MAGPGVRRLIKACAQRRSREEERAARGRGKGLGKKVSAAEGAGGLLLPSAQGKGPKLLSGPFRKSSIDIEMNDQLES